MMNGMKKSNKGDFSAANFSYSARSIGFDRLFITTINLNRKILKEKHNEEVQ